MTIEAANRTAQGLAAMLAPRQPRDISVAVASPSTANNASSDSLGVGTGVSASVSNEVRSLARDLAASPPVNSAKVAGLRAAIDAGTYMVQPQQLADAMIRAELL